MTESFATRVPAIGHPAESPHVLVVEDEQHLAIGIKYNLEAEGYRVTTVSEGPLALQACEDEKTPVDLVVLDLMLPGMSGYEVCQTLRSSGKEMPILILSARTLAEDRTRGFEVGADQYLMKPFELDEFLSRVKNLLARSPRSHSRTAKSQVPISRFSFGNARINFETFEVVVDGKPVRMTHLEMRLLSYFIQNQGRVIPRSELLEKVWDTSGRLNTRAPDQFIRRLRKIFEADPANPRYFVTIRDAGYRFVVAE